MKAQFESFSKELKSLGETYTKAATDLLNTSIKTNG